MRRKKLLFSAGAVAAAPAAAPDGKSNFFPHAPGLTWDNLLSLDFCFDIVPHVDSGSLADFDNFFDI